MKERIAEIVKKLPPSGIRRFFETTGDGFISFGVGAPDFPAPGNIRRACIETLERGITNYTSNQGLIELRTKIAGRNGLQYNPETEILITAGVSQGIDDALRAIINPCEGNEIIIPEPAYVAYRPDVLVAGGSPVSLPLSIESRFTVTVEGLKEKITNKTIAIILNYPHNPTGAVMLEEELREIASIIIENDLVVISDEIYGGLTYNSDCSPSIASVEGMKERTIILDGVSKVYAMTGFRIGFALGPEDLIGAMIKIHQFNMLCAPTVGQYGAIEALNNGNEEVKRMKEEYSRRAEVLARGLNKLGLKCFEPRGAFYAFPCIESTGMNSEEFTDELFEKQKVIIVPGNAFGECGEGYVRMSFAQTPVSQITHL